MGVGDIAVEREPAVAVARLDHASAEISGDVDLEPVISERIMPQHDFAGHRLADHDAVIQAQHARR
jgi:hypothetical protein